ncbi:hypothetical protein OG429_29005 [Streptomyces sp. NBC_00190]|uniref:hypothetical protein n=1 Tax=unclassified Streptomyces TaxID=2593676 RepID=UPI002E2B3E18|nr:hypothetical protein [Streptomyces sp. NBC_00190]WSZ42967.1 hypothetical protein OG239_31650 [Streptomyces sp. NBC_00868]
MAEQLYHPWGVVSPAFWTGGAAPEDPVAGAVAEEGVVEEPAAAGDRVVEASAAADAVAAPSPADSRFVEDALAAIRSAVGAAQKDKAVLLAEELDSAVTAEFGELHLDTVQVREIRGYLADLTGHAETGLAWYLHALRLRGALQGPDAPGTQQAARRAYSMWRTLQPARALAVATTLLDTVTDVLGPDSDAAHRTRRAIAALPGGVPASGVR